MLGHSFTETVTAPTCTEKGYTTYICKCGHSYTDNETEITSHQWSDWNTIKETTEEAEGAAERNCSVCSAKETKTLAKLQHVHKYVANVTAPTCTEKGYTAYTCKCGDSYTADEVEATGHSYTSTVTKKPSCTEKGVQTFTCKCGDSYTEEIAKLNHSYSRKVTAPTCTEKGSTTYTCSRGKSYTSDKTAATGHKWNTWEIVQTGGCWNFEVVSVFLGAEGVEGCVWFGEVITH